MRLSKIDRWTVKSDSKEREKREKFASECRKLRSDMSLSKDAMSRRLGISADMLMRVESGNVSPDAPGLKEKIKKLKTQERMVII